MQVKSRVRCAYAWLSAEQKQSPLSLGRQLVGIDYELDGDNQHGVSGRHFFLSILLFFSVGTKKGLRRSVVGGRASTNRSNRNNAGLPANTMDAGGPKGKDEQSENAPSCRSAFLDVWLLQFLHGYVVRGKGPAGLRASRSCNGRTRAGV